MSVRSILLQLPEVLPRLIYHIKDYRTEHYKTEANSKPISSSKGSQKTPPDTPKN